MPRKAKDITGLQVGYLTALRSAGRNERGKALWVFGCICGAEKALESSEMQKQKKRGITASCGCRRRATIAEKRKAHGMSKHPAFAVWRSMLDRCRLPSHRAYKNYGGRGISVCERWQRSFENFWADMGPTYSLGLTLDRRNNEQGYSPENCRWVSPVQQARNRRGNRYVQTPHGEMLLAEAAEVSGIRANTLAYRADHGVPQERMFDAPDVGRKFTTC